MRPQLRRRLPRVVGLRALRVARRHHFSILTAAVLIGALAVVLTNAGFTRPATAPSVPAAAVLDAAPSLSLPSTDQDLLIYYIVDSLDEIDGIRNAMRGDMSYLQEQGLPPLEHTGVYFLLFQTPEEEAQGARLLTQIAEMAPLEGFNLQVVDLTR